MSDIFKIPSNVLRVTTTPERLYTDRDVDGKTKNDICSNKHYATSYVRVCIHVLGWNRLYTVLFAPLAVRTISKNSRPSIIRRADKGGIALLLIIWCSTAGVRIHNS